MQEATDGQHWQKKEGKRKKKLNIVVNEKAHR